MAKKPTPANAGGSASPVPIDRDSASANPADTGTPTQVANLEPTTALDVFRLCIQRAENLVKIHQTAHGREGKPAGYLSDAHRAAIVLAISALDAYVRTIVMSRIREVIVRKHQALPKALSERIKHFLKDDELLEAARKDDLLDRVEKAFRRDFEKRTFQGIDAITSGLEWVGVNDVFKEIAVRARKNEETLRSDIERFTTRRHGIAHRGDYDFNSNPPREIAVKTDATACITLVTLIAEHIDGICKA